MAAPFQSSREHSEADKHEPVQITLIGSDGKGYMFLAKPKDDLRKDHRMMEVAGVINRLFAREPVSRRRNLYLRRYASVGNKTPKPCMSPLGMQCTSARRRTFSRAGRTCSYADAAKRATHCGVTKRDT